MKAVARALTSALRPTGTLLGQSVRFALVGGFNTLVDLIVFALLFYSLHTPVLSANAIAYCCGTLSGFFMNRYWTFAAQGSVVRQLPLYLLVYLFGLGLSTLTIWLLTPTLPVIAAKGVAIVVGAVWNFWSSRRFVYRHGAVPTRAPAETSAAPVRACDN